MKARLFCLMLITFGFLVMTDSGFGKEKKKEKLKPLPSHVMSRHRRYRSALLRKCREVMKSPASAPGRLCVLSENSFPVLVAGEEGDQDIIVAGTLYKKGRAVVVSHTDLIRNEENKQLLINFVEWTAPRGRFDKKKHTVASYRAGNLAAILKDAGYPARDEKEFKNALNADVIIYDIPTFKKYINNPDKADEIRAELSELRAAVAGGKGLVMSEMGWVRRGYDKVEDLKTHIVSTDLLGPMGIIPDGGYANIRKITEKHEDKDVEYHEVSTRTKLSYYLHYINAKYGMQKIEAKKRLKEKDAKQVKRIMNQVKSSKPDSFASDTDSDI